MGHNSGCNALRNKYKCKYCNRGYMMEWAYKNHMKLEEERIKSFG